MRGCIIMAKKAESFKLGKRKTKNGEIDVIILYTNVEPNQPEKVLIDHYLDKGFEPMFEEKKAGKKVEEMKKELKENDEEAFNKFEEIYSQKNGFFDACKYYNKWKKAKKDNENK